MRMAMPVVGFLRSAPFADATHVVMAFRQGRKDAGFVEGENVAVEYRSAESHLDRLPTLAVELVRRPVDVIVGNNISALVANAARMTIPIVFADGGEPVRDGLVPSLDRPGGNVTGVIFFAGGEATGPPTPTRAQGGYNRHACLSQRD
jgi:putative ABC transport system substrate-binding protein